jgi:nitroreductase
VEFSEVIKRRKMVRAFTGEPLAPDLSGRLLRAANRAPSAGFSQGYSFLVLEGAAQTAPLWELFYEDASHAGPREAEERAELAALSPAPLVIVTLASKDMYLDRYARPDKGWEDRDESHWPVPYWYIDTGFTALLILLAVVDEGLGAVFFGIPPEMMPGFRRGSGCRTSGRRLALSLSATRIREPNRCRQGGRVPVRAWTNWCTAAAGNGLRRGPACGSGDPQAPA